MVTFVDTVTLHLRAGKGGNAITLVTRREIRLLNQIERVTKAKIQFRPLPTASDVNQRRREALKRIVAEAAANRETFETYLEPIEELITKVGRHHEVAHRVDHHR